METPEEAQIEQEKQEELELLILAVLLIVSALLVYKHRDRIKAWFNELLGKFQ